METTKYQITLYKQLENLEKKKNSDHKHSLTGHQPWWIHHQFQVLYHKVQREWASAITTQRFNTVFFRNQLQIGIISRRIEHFNKTWLPSWNLFKKWLKSLLVIIKYRSLIMKFKIPYRIMKMKLFLLIKRLNLKSLKSTEPLT